MLPSLNIDFAFYFCVFEVQMVIRKPEYTYSEVMTSGYMEKEK